EDDHRSKVDDFSLANLHPKRDLTGVKAIDHIVVLQAALTGLIAYRTINGMVYQQEFQDATDSLLHSFVVRPHDHPFVHKGRARRCEFRHLLDIDQTHSAIAIDRQVLVIAIMRNLNAMVSGRLNDSLPVLSFDFLSV